MLQFLETETWSRSQADFKT